MHVHLSGRNARPEPTAIQSAVSSVANVLSTRVEGALPRKQVAQDGFVREGSAAALLHPLLGHLDASTTRGSVQRRDICSNLSQVFACGRVWTAWFECARACASAGGDIPKFGPAPAISAILGVAVGKHTSAGWVAGGFTRQAQ